MSFLDPDDYGRFNSQSSEKSPKQEIKNYSKEELEWLTNAKRDKPFFIDSFRKLLKQYDDHQISISKLVEELNLTAFRWRSQMPERAREAEPKNGLTVQPLNDDMQPQLPKSDVMRAQSAEPLAVFEQELNRLSDAYPPDSDGLRPREYMQKVRKIHDAMELISELTFPANGA